MKLKFVHVKYFKNCAREKSKSAREKTLIYFKKYLFFAQVFCILRIKIIFFRFFDFRFGNSAREKYITPVKNFGFAPVKS